jgi:hypothetical protein
MLRAERTGVRILVRTRDCSLLQKHPDRLIRTATLLSWGQTSQGVKLTTHIYLMPTSKNEWNSNFFYFARQPSMGHGLLIHEDSISHTTINTVGRTPLDEWSARRRDLYLTTHNTHNRQTSMPPMGFKPTILARKRPQTYALDRVATGISATVPFSTQYVFTVITEVTKFNTKYG